MPELPEVETTMRGIRPYLEGRVLKQLVISERRLRWPIEAGLERQIAGAKVACLGRRGKYIVIYLDRGGLLIHLGMSGSMRVLLKDRPRQPHDHFDLVTETGQIVRYRDPRRFGCLLYARGNPASHRRLQSLGVEPLSDQFTGGFLQRHAKRRKIEIKALIMDGRVVVGVGNIYASEALFDAGIHPLRRCDRISLERYNALVRSVKKILSGAIAQGGTTLKDFVGADGLPGYFEQQLLVYDRACEPCVACFSTIRKTSVRQRSTYYCAICQK